MVTAVQRSRLDLMIARLTTQRDCLAHAAELIAALDGWVLEIGLGKGRTYDHLRVLLPEREIFVFDRTVHAPAACVPDADHLILGEFRHTLPAFADRHGPQAALVHADIGSENRSADAALVAAIAEPLTRLIRPGGVMLCDRDLSAAGLPLLPSPGEGNPWPYFIYRADAGAGA